MTEDYLDKISDINSIIMLQESDFAFLDTLAPLGKRYRQKGLAVPLIMDPVYIQRSVEAFPIEFLSFKLVHHALYGEDLLAGLEINRQELKYQCDRELKGRIVWLQKNYVSAMGDRKALAADIVSHMDGYLPILRGILHSAGPGASPGPGKGPGPHYLLQPAVTLGFSPKSMPSRKIRPNLSKEEVSRLFASFIRPRKTDRGG